MRSRPDIWHDALVYMAIRLAVPVEVVRHASPEFDDEGVARATGDGRDVVIVFGTEEDGVPAAKPVRDRSSMRLVVVDASRGRLPR